MGAMQPTDDRSPAPSRRPRRTIVGVAAVIAAIAGGGAAVAATTLSSPQQESEAIVSDAAERLGVTPDRLSGARRLAYEAQIEARVADGSLGREQADRLKQALDDGELP